MPYKDPEKKRAHDRLYRESHLAQAVQRSMKYQRAYPEKKCELNRASYARHAEERRAQKRQYNAEHAEEIRAKKRARYLANPKSQDANKRRWKQENAAKVLAITRAYAAAHPERIRAASRKYYASHPDQRTRNNARRRAHRVARPTTFTREQHQFMLQYWGYACAVCGNQEGFEWALSLDHWVPLVAPECPGTVARNMVPLCAGIGGCNNSKGKKDPHDWLLLKYPLRRVVEIEKAIATYFALVLERFGEEPIAS